MDKLSTANPFVFLCNLYLFYQQHPRPIYRYTAIDHWPLQFHSSYFTERIEVREVCLHYLVYQHDYPVAAEVPRASQEINCKAGSMNAPRTLGMYYQTPLPCPVHGVRLFLLVLSKCIAVWQKGRQLTLCYCILSCGSLMAIIWFLCI